MTADAVADKQQLVPSAPASAHKQSGESPDSGETCTR